MRSWVLSAKRGELHGDPRFLTVLQLQQNVLFGGEVEVERPVRDACGGHDGARLRPATLNA